MYVHSDYHNLCPCDYHSYIGEDCIEIFQKSLIIKKNLKLNLLINRKKNFKKQHIVVFAEQRSRRFVEKNLPLVAALKEQNVQI